MASFDGKAFGAEIVSAVKGYLAREIGGISARLDAFERRLDALPAARDGKDADEEAIAARVRDDLSAEIKELRCAIEAIPPAPELPDIDGMVEEAVSAARAQDVAQVQEWMGSVDEKFAVLPVPPDGKDADPELIKRMVDEAVAAIPPAPAGKDADPEIIRQMVAEVVAELPPARDGKDAEPIDPDDVRSMVAEIVGPAVAAIPAPQDGKSVTIDDVRPVIEDAVARAVAALPKAKDGEPGKDGIGVAGAVIDRDGSLVVTLSNGDTKQLGRVVGKDGEPGKPGHDGFSLKEFEVELMEDGRTVLMKFDDGGPFSYAKEIGFPVVLDRGVWREDRPEGPYQKGDGVTWAGSWWIAQRDNPGKPDTADGGWRLAVKRGRDAKGAA